ncbi:non-specific serine/threonine protein kinase [Trifolium repens]|nr:non-specific serine/threonine protein kinase [Trifolium repens]WJX47517.1 non-specific serine/threonine protein kinase [Trifolium repens]
MAYNGIETVLAREYLRAPLNLEPANDQEKYINDMRTQYRTYYLEYNVHDGAVMLPRMFSDDFGSEISRLAILVDSHSNMFEVLVDKINENVYFTRGWSAIRDFYDIRFGAWLILMYTGMGYFGLTVEDRLHRLITPPTFVPPATFIIDKSDVPGYFVNDLPESTRLLAYSHPGTFYQVEYEKTLTYYDVCTGFLVLPYNSFGRDAFDEATTSIRLVDDCGNAWVCDLIFVTFPCKYYKVGGEWNRMVVTKRLSIGDVIRVGVQGGHSECLYLTLNP